MGGSGGEIAGRLNDCMHVSVGLMSRLYWTIPVLGFHLLVNTMKKCLLVQLLEKGDDGGGEIAGRLNDCV